MFFSGTAVCEGGLSVEIAYSLYFERVNAFAMGYVHDFEAAQDYTQETWMRAVKYWHTFDGANPLGWLRSILKSVIREHFKSNGHNVVSLDPYLDERADVLHRTPQALICEDDLNYVLAVLDDSPVVLAFKALPEREREALACKVLYKKDAEAAQELNISRATYALRVHAARQAILRSLGVPLEPMRTSLSHSVPLGPGKPRADRKLAQRKVLERILYDNDESASQR